MVTARQIVAASAAPASVPTVVAKIAEVLTTPALSIDLRLQPWNRSLPCLQRGLRRFWVLMCMLRSQRLTPGWHQ